MPFVKVATNLARNQLPKSFMPKFNAQLAVILNKDEKVFKWQLETDKYMAVVSDRSLEDYIYPLTLNATRWLLKMFALYKGNK